MIKNLFSKCRDAMLCVLSQVRHSIRVLKKAVEISFSNAFFDATMLDMNGLRRNHCVSTPRISIIITLLQITKFGMIHISMPMLKNVKSRKGLQPSSEVMPH